MLRARLAAVCVLGSAACALPHAELRDDGGVRADITVTPDVVQPDRVVPVPDVIDDVAPVDVSCPTAQVRCAGTCVDTQTDANNCGTCGMACGAGNECVGGACRMICAAPRRTCGAACVDVQSDTMNCGACGMMCAGGQVCSSGACTTTCALTMCGAACVDTQTSPAHCGGCNRPCPAAQMCAAGACACPVTGQTLCGAACVNTQTDSSNCGVCGTVCRGGATCMAGMCRCPAGQHQCGASCVPDTSITQCGASCMACPAPPANATANCTGGACGYACNAGYAPQGALCVLACAANQHVCNNACVNNNSVMSCGTTSCTACPSPGANGMPTCNGTSCGIACNSPFVVNGSNCVCPVGQHACGSTCALDSSITQCGAGCVMCPMPPANAHAVCAAGLCASECNVGYVPTPMGCSVVSAPCGNGVIDALESCDDGRPAASGDGCSATCQIEPAYVGELCGSGHSIFPLATSQTIRLATTTTGAGATGDGCGALGPELVYSVRTMVAGRVSIRLAPSGWRAVLKSGTGPGICTTDCATGAAAGSVLTRFYDVAANTIVSVAVDGVAATDHGNFTLDFTMTP